MQQHIFDRYADGVIGTKPEDFDAIEVHGVRGSPGNPDVVECDNEHPDFFSVYLHYKPENSQHLEGIQCAGDFSLRANALGYADELHAKYGWTIHDHTIADAKPMRPWQRITDDMLLGAGRLPDIDAAALHVQQLVGITDGSIAALALEDHCETWPQMKASERVMALEKWREAERDADLDYAPPEPENVHLTLVYAGLRLLQRSLTTLPEPIIDLLAQDGISVETTAERHQLEQEIDKVCEMTNTAMTDGTDEVIEALRAVLPYAQTRAKDLIAAETSPAEKEAALKAWDAVNAAHKLLGTEP